ncbi:helix-turn-helix transcriptional regulator [bacterium]|nr:helix-turn-helix transcriptional regulator [bacterium]
MNTKVLERLGKKIKLARKEAGYTQEILAEKLSIHPTYVGKLEGGKNNPSFMLLYKMSKALKVKIKDLLDIE